MTDTNAVLNVVEKYAAGALIGASLAAMQTTSWRIVDPTVIVGVLFVGVLLLRGADLLELARGD